MSWFSSFLSIGSFKTQHKHCCCQLVGQEDISGVLTYQWPVSQRHLSSAVNQTFVTTVGWYWYWYIYCIWILLRELITVNFRCFSDKCYIIDVHAFNCAYIVVFITVLWCRSPRLAEVPLRLCHYVTLINWFIDRLIDWLIVLFYFWSVGRTAITGWRFGLVVTRWLRST